jgi:hypothetical protein
MSARRVVAAATAVLVAVLLVVLMVLHWNAANKVAVVVSALAAVAAVGVAVWATLPAVRTGGMWASRTGRATAGPGGRANSGVWGPAGSLPDDVRVDRTGDAEASGGDANTGVQMD